MKATQLKYVAKYIILNAFNGFIAINFFKLKWSGIF